MVHLFLCILQTGITSAIQAWERTSQSQSKVHKKVEHEEREFDHRKCLEGKSNNGKGKTSNKKLHH